MVVIEIYSSAASTEIQRKEEDKMVDRLRTSALSPPPGPYTSSTPHLLVCRYIDFSTCRF